MSSQSIIHDLSHNYNTGVEYEIALFYTLLYQWPDLQQKYWPYIEARSDFEKIKTIIQYSNPAPIVQELSKRELNLTGVSLETQNDNVGPADIVLSVTDKNGKNSLIGLSIKFSNTCRCNISGRKFLSPDKISHLKFLLPSYIDMYVDEMTNAHGEVTKWFRKRLQNSTTDNFIDLIREAVIEDWDNVPDKIQLMNECFQLTSPIEFWVITYSKRGYKLNTHPLVLTPDEISNLTLEKFKTSYIGFRLNGKMIAKMQVKFNNGILEKSKKSKPDITVQGIEMAYGKPFSSWNFSLIKK